MKHLHAAVVIIAITSWLTASAQLTAHRGTVRDSYNFWLYNPQKSAADTLPKPLVVFLHGASLCGRNLDRVKRYGTIDAISKGRELDAFVIAPQNPGGAWNPRKIMEIVDWAAANYSIDTSRIYAIGMSLGGFGTIDLAATYPERIAAAMAMCGGASVNDLSGLNEVPLWIIHGTADRAVSVSQSDRVVRQMQADNDSTPRLIYDRVAGMNHSRPARILYLPESYEWLLSHSLNDTLRAVSAGFDIDNDMLRSAYRNLKHTPATKKKRHTRKKHHRKK